MLLFLNRAQLSAAATEPVQRFLIEADATTDENNDIPPSAIKFQLKGWRLA